MQIGLQTQPHSATQLVNIYYEGMFLGYVALWAVTFYQFLLSLISKFVFKNTRRVKYILQHCKFFVSGNYKNDVKNILLQEKLYE